MRRGDCAGMIAIAAGLIALGAQAGCARDDAVSCDGDPPEITRPDFWTRASHCRGVPPDYGELFDDGVVHEIRITISAADHAAMEDDLSDVCGPDQVTPDLDALPAPIWVPATVTYGGKQWTQVGMRWKGHASLKGAYSSGIKKLSFMLAFDHFEDLYPDLQNQRFYGFKGLTFSNAYNDPSLIREKVAAEVFRAAGVKVARSAFAPVTLDWGAGPVYLGLYTMIEDPADAMLEEQFGWHENGKGNLYKPWSDAARWLPPPTPDTPDGGPDEWAEEIAEHFEKATNDDVADWSDIERVIEKLHGDRNVPALWRADLETVLDVRSFLRTLAVNQAIVNWDSYGCMHHNYYVYSNPRDFGRFVWFPWDMNEAMLYREKEGCPAPGSVMLEEIMAEEEDETGWPLIRFILDDPVYRAAYIEDLRAVLDGPFAAESVIAMMRRYHDLVAPWVVGPNGTEVPPYKANGVEDGFAGSLTAGDDALEPLVYARHAAVEAALGE